MCRMDSQMDRRSERQSDGHTYRWTHIQIDTHTDGQAYRWTDIKMERRTVDIHKARLLIDGCRVR
jgi:hypothetical protein